jgi:hypothetical protein
VLTLSKPYTPFAAAQCTCNADVCKANDIEPPAKVQPLTVEGDFGPPRYSSSSASSSLLLNSLATMLTIVVALLN